MDFKDQIKALGERANKLRLQVNTEEATKNAFIMPFIKELGYDVFNPSEVTPELVADMGMKQGEKIDYAILKNGEPIILIECKHHANALNVLNESQLFRYFHATKAKFAILTNGLEYRFYTDLVEPNKMDEKPFFSFNIIDIKDNQIEELRKFHKEYYDFDNIVNTASELKYTSELRGLIHSEVSNPSPDFVKYFAKQVYNGVVTAKVLEQFTGLTKKTFNNYINDLINDRLKAALEKETASQKQEEALAISEIKANDIKIETTAEEMESFYIIKGLLCGVVDSSRIYFRDAQSYFSVILDDNNRKPICRLYLNGTKKYIGLFDESKKEIKSELNTIEDIYKFKNLLINTVQNYDKSKEVV